MAMAASILSFSPSSSFRTEVKADKPRVLNFAVQAKGKAAESRNEGGSGSGGGGGRQIWRRRKLGNDKVDRVPFLEEEVVKIRDRGKMVIIDSAKLMLREGNRYEFVNNVAAEAVSYVERNRDEYGSKKAIYHVLSNRISETFGFNRPEAYKEEDLFKPRPRDTRDKLP